MATLALMLLLGVSSLPSFARAQADVVLSDGEPMDGFVAPFAFAYFTVPIPASWPAAAAGININVTPLGDADPDCQGTCDASNSTGGAGGKTIAGRPRQLAGWLRILRGISRAICSGIVSAAHNITRIFVDSVCCLCSFHVCSSPFLPVFGDWTPHPSVTSNTWSSSFGGEDTIFVPAAAIGTHTELYLSVQGYQRAANFTIVFQIENPVQLTDGQPQYAFVHKGGFTTFWFQAATHDSLAISASGSTKIYVGVDESFNPPSAGVKWQSAYTGAPVNIHASDSKYPATGRFSIAVLGYLSDAYFIISATLNGTATELTNGVPVQSHIEPSENAYYTYTSQ
jgi:hypothetical protein